MTASWVAGTVRAEALARRRIGAGAARALASCPTWADALTALSATPYGHDVSPTATLVQAQHGVGATLLWHLRVLAGWLPRSGADVIRLLARGFEIAGIDDQLARLAGTDTGPAYRLGALDTASRRVAEADSPAAVRECLRSSAWGDPGGTTPREISLGARLAWAGDLVARIPEASGWARTAAALLVAREVLVDGRRWPTALDRRASVVLGGGFVDAAGSPSASVAGLSALLPSGARGAFSGVDRPEDLWRAEAAWWHRLEREGFTLLRGSGFERGPITGAVAVLAADAWRVRAALEAAARRTVTGPAVMEAFDGVA
ncbi:hypothetical protein ERC79_10090 [Rhodococcus sp. ABRD24]|uniref:hypothetical protein n=1 Tax=Rhodococcus sp. ABRD24 TaxID=2507582 RepID=UPI00103CA9F7|nr:hypothetical protein [Rhodococcus sp. ABRD24]QBJ96277.1 hypothetical protein ERC79_10090 [Rhodococcus sp. ABRD24]